MLLKLSHVAGNKLNLSSTLQNEIIFRGNEINNVEIAVLQSIIMINYFKIKSVKYSNQHPIMTLKTSALIRGCALIHPR